VVLYARLAVLYCRLWRTAVVLYVMDPTFLTLMKWLPSGMLFMRGYA
jgi:hypothetical protein